MCLSTCCPSRWPKIAGRNSIRARAVMRVLKTAAVYYGNDTYQYTYCIPLPLPMKLPPCTLLPLEIFLRG